jgi:hypothetical protein
MGIGVTRIFFSAVATKDRTHIYTPLHNTALSDTAQPSLETKVITEYVCLSYSQHQKYQTRKEMFAVSASDVCRIMKCYAVLKRIYIYIIKQWVLIF